MIDRELDNAIALGKSYGDQATKHALFTRLRRADPVHWTEPDGVRPFWLLSRHADIVAVCRQNELFINGPRTRMLTIEYEERVRKFRGGKTHLTRGLNQMDGAEHKKYRQVLANWFLPAQIRNLEAQCAALARRTFAELREQGGECDLNEVIAYYPLRVIMGILGLPDADAPMLLRNTKVYFSGDDPDMQKGSDAIAAAQVFKDYFDLVAADRLAHPRDDLASLIAHATIDDRPMNQYESTSMYVTFMGAGHDTTSATIAGGALALIQHPDQWRQLRDEPRHLDSTALDEILRWVTPSNHKFRTASRDCEIRGTPIREGEAVMMVWPSANRDEEVFDDPFAFRVDRQPNRHVAFGGPGLHACLGMHLAKLEMRCFYREMFEQVEGIELTGQPAWVESAFVSGLKQLPVRVRFK